MRKLVGLGKSGATAESQMTRKARRTGRRRRLAELKAERDAWRRVRHLRTVDRSFDSAVRIGTAANEPGTKTSVEGGPHTTADLREELVAVRRQLVAALSDVNRVSSELAETRREVVSARSEANRALRRSVELQELLGREKTKGGAASFDSPDLQAAPRKRERRARVGSPSDRGKINIRQVSFPELREWGLSLTQAKRLLDYRGAGHFDGRAIEALDDVPGLPKAVQQRLKRRLVA